MTEWYYARGGQQSGPVTFEQLGELARSGGLDPAKDLVWTATMKDWTPAGQVPELFPAPAKPVPAPPTDPANPYAAPQSPWVAPAAAPDTALEHIIPGSEPIDAVACVKRGFELTKRQFGIIIVVGLAYFGVTIGASLILGLIDSALGIGHSTQSQWQSDGGHAVARYQQNGSPLNILVSQVLSVFLSLGLVRVGLNLVSGKEVSVGMLFGEGRKLLPAIGASILFGLMVVVGLILLVVPGIYIALRYGQFMTAIVDRNLGVLESLAYSSSITTNNRLNLLVLWLLSFVILLAGALACGVGLVFAGPVVWLASMVAYRWMQCGPRAATDQSATTPAVPNGQ